MMDGFCDSAGHTRDLRPQGAGRSWRRWPLRKVGGRRQEARPERPGHAWPITNRLAGTRVWPRRPATSPRVPRSRADPSVCGLGASCGAQPGGVRPPPPPGLGAACVCCARYATSWSPASSSSCSWMMVSRSKIARLLCPVRSMATRSGTLARIRVRAAAPAAIVEEAGRHAGRLAGGAPRRAPAADGDTVAVEDERAGEVAACPPSVQCVGGSPTKRVLSARLAPA